MPLISVIVPVYKVERYLCQCLDSVLSQTFTDYECILVDDGSPDRCPEICDEYVKKDSRFKVIHKKRNEGLPMARKSGLDIAISDFVFHLDSDDWIEIDTLSLLYMKQKETNAEIVIGNFYEICPWGTQKKYFVPIKSCENPIEWLLLCQHKFLWGKLYRKAIYRDYIVPSDGIFEDIIVNIQLFSILVFHKIQFIDSFIYNYNAKTSTNSLITQLRSKKYDSYMEHPTVIAYLKVYDFLKDSMCKNDVYSAFAYSFLNDAGVPYYLRGNINVHKKEIHNLYTNYYKKCFHLPLMKMHHRIFLPLCNFSVVFGKIFIYICCTALRIRVLFNKKREC